VARPLRIIYLSGLWYHDLWFLKHLAAAGHDVTSIRIYRTPGMDRFEKQLEGMKGVRHQELTHWFPEAMASGGIPELTVARRLRAFLHVQRADILQCGWLSDGGVLAALTGFHPLLITPFGSDVLINPYRSLEHLWKARLALRCADALTTDSIEVAHRISQISGYPHDRIVRFPWGIDLARFRPDAIPAGIRKTLGWEKRTVLIATRNLEPVYGTAFLLQALPGVLKVRPDVALLVVGDGSERRLLEETARDLGIRDCVRFVGYVPNAELQGLLVESDYCVTAALSDGTSRSLMEAFACGLPAAAATDVPAVFEWMKEGVHGSIVRRADAPDMTRGILKALAADRGSMRDACLRTARESFDENRNIARLQGMYEALMAGQRSPLPEPRQTLPALDLGSVNHVPYVHPSWRARAAEWLVIAALWRRSRRMRRS